MKPEVTDDNQTPTPKQIENNVKDFLSELKINKENLEIKYPENGSPYKNSQEAFNDIVKIFSPQQENTSSQEEQNPLAPAQKTNPVQEIQEKIKTIEQSDTKDYRIEAFAKASLGILNSEESKENTEEHKQKALQVLQKNFGFLSEKPKQEEGYDNQFNQFSEAFLEILKSNEVSDNHKKLVAESCREAVFAESKKPQLNEEKSVDQNQIQDPQNLAENTAKKDNSEDPKKTEKSDNFLDKHDVKMSSVAVGVGRFGIALALCCAVPGFGPLLAIGFLMATSGLGSDAVKRKDGSEVDDDTKKQVDEEIARESEIRRREQSAALESAMGGKIYKEAKEKLGEKSNDAVSPSQVKIELKGSENSLESNEAVVNQIELNTENSNSKGTVSAGQNPEIDASKKEAANQNKATIQDLSKTFVASAISDALSKAISVSAAENRNITKDNKEELIKEGSNNDIKEVTKALKENQAASVPNGVNSQSTPSVSSKGGGGLGGGGR